MSLDQLDESDIKTLRELLKRSGRTAFERRKALCIEIDVNPSDISAIMQTPVNDFAVLLIDDLVNRRLETAICKLCQELDPEFRGGEYAPQLATIICKLNCNYKLESDSPTPIPEVARQDSVKATKPQPKNDRITKDTLTSVQPGKKERQSWLNSSRLGIVLMTSLAVTSLLTGLRFFGLLERWELKTFDHFVQVRSDEKKDNRILIVAITDEDILKQDDREEKGQGSLRDPSLNRLLKTLKKHKPRVIGLDLYRPFKVDTSVPGLLEELKQKHIVAVCKAPTIDEQGNLRNEVKPPKEVPLENTSFSDFVADPDDTVRRHLIAQEQIRGANCRTQQSFSLLLARRYLELEPEEYRNYKNPFSSGENLELGNTVFEQLQPFTGGYQDVDASGYQVLLNYRATSDGKVAKELTLEQVLNNQFDGEKDVSGKIVLIGSYAEQQGPPDRWSTPYGTIPGVMVHAHMTSQILSAVLDRRSLLRVWSQGIEIFWIWGWSLAGGIFAYYWRSFKFVGIAVIVALLVLYVICWASLAIASFWIPLIPPALALILTSFTVMYIVDFFKPDIAPLSNQL